jgi:hypothetical protein
MGVDGDAVSGWPIYATIGDHMTGPRGKLLTSHKDSTNTQCLSGGTLSPVIVGPGDSTKLAGSGQMTVITQSR